jgi:1-deoxy-D-xylulose-5-phosphate synthase
VEYLLKRIPAVGDKLFETAKRIQKSAASLLKPGSLFEELGFKYVGPVDGHDLDVIIDTLRKIKPFKIPILLHVLTKKGKGYEYAEAEPSSFHGIRAFDVETGEPVSTPGKKSDGPTFSSVFGNHIIQMAKDNPKIVAITAAMAEGTGLNDFADRYPDRLFDVGIAEQHAVTFAAGLASEGYRPVVAIYSTFLQRAYDQICHDVCLQNVPVIFAIDRAGVVGSDGPTHHGLFDVAYLRTLPNITIMAPKDGMELKRMLDWAQQQEQPVAIRYPRGSAGPENDEQQASPIELGQPETMREGHDIAIVALGPMVATALEAADELAGEGISVGVINARFVKPLNERFYCELAEHTKGIITIEDGTISGGFGNGLVDLILKTKPEKASGIVDLGFPDKFIEHGPRSALLRKYGMSVEGILKAANRILGAEIESNPHKD